MSGYRFRLSCLAGLLGVMLGAPLAPAAAPDPNDPWPGLVQDIFNNRAMNDGADIIAIEMPYRAEDAAIVPVTLRTKLAGRRQPPRAADHAGDRPESRAVGGEVRTGAGRQCFGNLDARAHQQLYRRACGGRAERRQALYGQDLCEGIRRLLRARRQDRRRRQKQTGSDAIPSIRAACPGACQRRPRGADHDRTSQQFRPADGPGHAALRSRLLRRPVCRYGRTTARCWRWKAGSRYRKIPISGSPMFPTARNASVPRPGTPKATSSGTNGRSTIPACDEAHPSRRPLRGPSG